MIEKIIRYFVHQKGIVVSAHEPTLHTVRNFISGEYFPQQLRKVQAFFCVTSASSNI